MKKSTLQLEISSLAALKADAVASAILFAAAFLGAVFCVIGTAFASSAGVAIYLFVIALACAVFGVVVASRLEDAVRKMSSIPLHVPGLRDDDAA